MAKQITDKPSFEEFLSCFPPVELPFTLGEDTHMLFSKENDPIPGAVIAEYILPLEGEEELDEVTEYIACFALPSALRLLLPVIANDKNGTPIMVIK